MQRVTLLGTLRLEALCALRLEAALCVLRLEAALCALRLEAALCALTKLLESHDHVAADDLQGEELRDKLGPRLLARPPRDRYEL